MRLCQGGALALCWLFLGASASAAAIALFEHAFEFSLRFSNLFTNLLNLLLARFPLGFSLLPCRSHATTLPKAFPATTSELVEITQSIFAEPDYGSRMGALRGFPHSGPVSYFGGF